MSSMDKVLSSTYSHVRAVGVELSNELCNRLPHSLLCDNLSTLVVGLFPTLEKEKDTVSLTTTATGTGTVVFK